MRDHRCRHLSLLASALLAVFTSQLHAEERLVFVSAFGVGAKDAIHAYMLDLTTGKLKLTHRMTDVQHPFYLAISPNQNYLYSIHGKTFGGKENEEVAAFEIVTPNGQLKLLNHQSARGTAACFLDVDATGKSVLVANYLTGSVASFPVKADGSLDKAASFFQHTGSSVDVERQKEPHAHCFVISPDNRFAFVADLGLDQILAYRLDAATAKLTQTKPPFARTAPGAGPRHLAFHPDGKKLYVINEIISSVTLFEYDPESGKLSKKQTMSTLPKDFTGRSFCADVKITPDGRHLYGTNRGHDSIARYRLGEDGRMTLLGIDPSLGKGPQNLAITPDGKLLLCANMPGNNIAVFRIDAKSGSLTSVGPPVEMPGPSCIRILPKQ